MNQSDFTAFGQYYAGPERRCAIKPRRSNRERRHRRRSEALLSDCRSGQSRRWEDDQGFYEIASLYSGPDDRS